MSSFSSTLEYEAEWDPDRVKAWLDDTEQIGHHRRLRQEFAADYQQYLANTSQSQDHSYTQGDFMTGDLQILATGSPAKALLDDLGLPNGESQAAAAPNTAVDPVVAPTMTTMQQSPAPTGTTSQQKQRRSAGDADVDAFVCPRCSHAYVKKRSAQDNLVKFHGLAWEEAQKMVVVRQSEVSAPEPLPVIEEQPWTEGELEEPVPMKIVVKPYGVVFAPDNGTPSPPPPGATAAVVDDGETLGSRDTPPRDPMRWVHAAQNFKLWEDEDADQDTAMDEDDGGEDEEEEF